MSRILKDVSISYYFYRVNLYKRFNIKDGRVVEVEKNSRGLEGSYFLNLTIAIMFFLISFKN